MAKQSLSQLDSRGQVVEKELAQAANTADRIGKLLRDIIASMPNDFDPEAEDGYKAGQWVIWKGRLVRCFADTVKGESPATASAKWTDFVANSLAIIDGSNAQDYPVTVGGLVPFVAREVKKANGGPYTGPDKASEAEIVRGVNDTHYITPYLLNIVYKQLAEIISKVSQTPGLGAVTLVDHVAQTIIQALAFQVSEQPTFGSGDSAVWLKQSDGNYRLGRGNGSTTPTTPTTPTDPYPDQDYAVQISDNTCKVIKGFGINSRLPEVPVSLKVYINNEYDSTITASVSMPELSAQFGLVNKTGDVYGVVYNVPAAIQNNQINTIDFRQPVSGKTLVSVKTPGHCGVSTDPTPAVPIVTVVGIYTEKPATPGSNPAPTVDNDRGQDFNKTQSGDYLLQLPKNKIQDAGDTLTYRAESYANNGYQSLPYGLVYDSVAQTIFMPKDLPYGMEVLLFITGKDTAGQEAHYYFLLSAYVQQTTGPVVIQRIPDSALEITEGGGYGYVRVRENLSNNTSRYRLASTFTVTAETPYPNNMTLEVDPTTGRETFWRFKLAANTIDKDGILTLLLDCGADGKLESQVNMIDVPAVTKVYYAFYKNNPAGGNPGVIQIYVVGSGAIEMATKASDFATKSTYSVMNAGSFGGGKYNFSLDLVGAYTGQNYILYFRAAGTSADLITATITTLPNGNVAITQIYPITN